MFFCCCLVGWVLLVGWLVSRVFLMVFFLCVSFGFFCLVVFCLVVCGFFLFVFWVVLGLFFGCFGVFLVVVVVCLFFSSLHSRAVLQLDTPGLNYNTHNK